MLDSWAPRSLQVTYSSFSATAAVHIWMPQFPNESIETAI